MRRKPPITIFGAGIAGLTAAHELATRGFTVEVIDPDYNEHDDTTNFDRGIGGMARSQWAVALGSSLGTSELQHLWTGSDLLLDVKLCFANGKPTDEERAADVLDRLATALNQLGPIDSNAIRICVHGIEDDALSTDSRVAYLREAFTARSLDVALVEKLVYASSDGSNDHISFVMGWATVVPAEHGFRFFPSFYRHLFDTMRRTPILTPTPAQRTKPTVFDNLVPAQGLGFARAGKATSFIVPRHQMSLEETRRILEQVLDELGYTAADIARFSLKIFKYMTSSSKRRDAEYEDTSWGEFLESWRYSPVSREHIEFGPQMSAALRGSASDARTQGNITIQLMMDQLKPDSLADYTLSGPTSSYWFDHWHDFLKSEGVTFVRGTLRGFEARGKEIVPVVSGGIQPKGELFVLALSLPAIAPLARELLAVAAQIGVDTGLDDLERIGMFAGDLRSLANAKPSAPLQHLSGIQYYFDQDLRFWRGHTQYLDSAWGLTSIAQPQFWARARAHDDGYRSILSVDIGIFDRPYTPKGGGTPKTAWECNADEIARHAWEQIVDHHDDAFRKQYGEAAEIPTPIAYAFDGTLTFEGGRRGPLTRNGSPFLVNKTGEYASRPGRLERTPGRSKTVSCYDVILGKYVLAGTFMQTFTRLTSMEGANESARHAVNALLQRLNVPGDRCEIWDPEDHELDDLQWFKDLDEDLFERNLPHFVDILGWDELPDQLELVRTMARSVTTTRRHNNNKEGV